MNGTQLYTADVSVLRDTACFEAALALADEARRDKIRRLQREEDRLLSLGAALLLKTALTRHGVTDQTLRVTRGGKPYLLSNACFFNLAHSGERVLCAVSDREVGCDIERCGPLRPAVIKRLHPQEQALFGGLNGDAQRRLLYRLWTLKESVLKQNGKGLGGGLSTFAVAFDGEQPYIAEGADQHLSLSEWTVDGYYAAVCAYTAPAAIEAVPLF